MSKGVSCEPGEVVYGCLLDWDFDKKIVVVSLTPELVAERKAVEAHKGKQKKVELFKVVLTKCEKIKVLVAFCARFLTLPLLASSHNTPYKFC